MITPSFGLTATERVLPKLALDFTTATLDARITITRTLDTATRTNSTGVIEVVNANLPRFDYNPTTLVCQGLLIEEARTNLLLNSLIDGTSLTTQSVTVAATAYTLSFYGTGSIDLSGTHTATVTGTGAYPSRKTYTFTPTAGTLTLTVTGTVQYAQLEAGSFATSFIPTSASSVTRNADVATMTGTNFSSWYNTSQGSFVIKWDFVGVGPTGGFVLGTNTAHRVVYTPSNPRTYDGTTIVNSGVSPATGSTNVACSTYGATTATIACNGAATVSGSYNGVAATTTAIQFMTNYSSSNNYTNGHLYKLFYYPQQLTAAEVRAFSKG